jgi:hypothetical protein
LFELNDYAPWRALFGLEEPDSRMRDIEFILRFFALSSAVYKADSRDKISLRRFLDLFMKNNAVLSTTKARQYKRRFTKSIDLIHETFGENAFHNISLSDSSRFVPKFSPTIFDSILIAADNAIIEGNYALPRDAERARRKLLTDEDYKKSISQETMRKESINTRVSKASALLFGIDYEQ